MKQIRKDIIQEEKPEVEKLLNFLCKLGKMLIQNGAEIYRVEGSIEHVAISFGYPNIEIFAIPAFITVTIEENGINHTKTIRVNGASNNLERLEKLNALSRKICAEPITLKASEAELNKIENCKKYPKWVNYIAHGDVSMFFTLFFGGGIFDMLVAFVCGLAVKLISEYTSKQKTNLFFANVLGGASIAVLPTALSCFFPELFHLDIIIIGAIMLLVPGVAITNVMRDMLSGDLVTAITKFAEVLIVGIGIAVGIAISLLAVKRGISLIM